ncbi:MAG: hypothetical protein Q8P88_02575 [Candidatus Jorgensenbacteria bacterium]|nr:hypothetical protein [Candidatus Jorgensenbacteria bacterium]
MNGTSGIPTNTVAEQFVAERLPVGWPWRLLVFAIALFAFSLLVYFGVKIGYTKYLEDRIVGVDAALLALSGEVTSEEQEQFVNFYSQIVNLKTVLDKHPYGGNIFTFLERFTLPEVQFVEAELDADDRVLTLRGNGPSIDIVGQQLAALESASGVARVLLRDVNVAGRVTFSLTIFFSDSFFERPLL